MDADDSFNSSSDDDYSQNEKILLDKYQTKKGGDSESETEVFGVGGSASEDDSNDQSDIALSDVEGQDERDDLPDVRAWGKEKKKYYGTDYVDQDYGGYQGKDAESAEIEEQEAKNLQSQLIQQLDDDDFAFDLIFKKSDKEKPEDDQAEETIKTDISRLSTKEKIQLLQKESPEMFALISDFETKMILVRDYLQPILNKHKNGEIPNSKAVEFVQTHHELILSYLCNIYMYLLLKNNKKLRNHPVIKKLYQYRQLLSQLEPVFEEVMKPQIEIILQEDTVQLQDKIAKKNKKMVVKLLENLRSENSKKKSKVERIPGEPVSKKIKLDKKTAKKGKEDKKKVKFAKELKEQESGASETEDAENNELEQFDDIGDGHGDKNGEVGKRAITYQIAKNKGLTPHRKKINRNPRVKHKLKFRKAVIRRKGAVREPRKELSRYGGEISGIKAHVSKSIKLKS